MKVELFFHFLFFEWKLLFLSGQLSRADPTQNCWYPDVRSDTDLSDHTVDRADLFPRRAPALCAPVRAYFSRAHLGARAHGDCDEDMAPLIRTLIIR